MDQVLEKQEENLLIDYCIDCDQEIEVPYYTKRGWFCEDCLSQDDYGNSYNDIYF